MNCPGNSKNGTQLDGGRVRTTEKAADHRDLLVSSPLSKAAQEPPNLDRARIPSGRRTWKGTSRNDVAQHVVFSGNIDLYMCIYL